MPRRTIKENKVVIHKKQLLDVDNLYTRSKFKIITDVKNTISYSLKQNKDSYIMEYLDSKTYARNKFFTGSIGDLDYDDVIHSLSKKAFILYKWIKANILYGSNKIILPTILLSNILEENNKSVISRTLKELIDKLIIAKSDDLEKDCYCINHNLFFIGNYNKFINSHIKIYDNDDDYDATNKEWNW